jgi:hypothetical protein
VNLCGHERSSINNEKLLKNHMEKKKKKRNEGERFCLVWNLALHYTHLVNIDDAQI